MGYSTKFYPLTQWVHTTSHARIALIHLDNKLTQLNKQENNTWV